MVLLSISRANRYKNCPRSYRYRYVDKIEEGESKESALGITFHQILDHWADNYLKSKDIRDSMRQAFLKGIKERNPGSNEIKALKDWIKEYTKILERNPPKILGHEEKFEFEMDEFLIRGAIDRIDEIDKETIQVVDYKVGSSRYINDKQVSVYGEALLRHPLYKTRKIVGQYIFINEGCRTIEYEITTERTKKALLYLQEIGKQICDEENWNPGFSPLCGWCSYKIRCMHENNKSVDWDSFGEY